MYDALIAAGLFPKPQYIVTFYTIDLALPEYQLAIECDGEYWHSTPKQQSKDRAKDTFLRRQGWEVIRLTEHDIKTSIDICVQRVLTKINKPSC